MAGATSKHPKGVMSASAKGAARARARAWYKAHWEAKALTKGTPKRTAVFFDADRFEIIAEAMASYRHKHQHGEQQ